MTFRFKVDGRANLKAFERLADRLADRRALKDLHRGVIDAGRKTKTSVQRAVHAQMATKSYQSGVVAGTRQKNDAAELSSTIFAVPGGQPIAEYRGFRTLKTKTPEAGAVKSTVWNSPRVFKRSFVTERGAFALLPGGETQETAPRAFWTYGAKPDQQRDAAGRFGKGKGKKYGKVRRLFGPSLREELGLDDSARTFDREAPKHLREQVVKRLSKLIKY